MSITQAQRDGEAAAALRRFCLKNNVHARIDYGVTETPWECVIQTWGKSDESLSSEYGKYLSTAVHRAIREAARALRALGRAA